MKKTGRRSKHFYCGTSNVVLPVPNKSHFPPEYREKSRLAYYSSVFNTVEINSSFYRIPLQRTVERWSAEVVDDFRFTFKLWKGITHARELTYDVDDIHRFMASVNAVGLKKACILVQFPASIKATYFKSVERILRVLRGTGGAEQWKIAVEFRDRSWYADKVYNMLRVHGAALVRHDMPKSFAPEADTGVDFSFFRFHGEKGDYRGTYGISALQEYAGMIKAELNMGKSVYAYFNNSMGGAVVDAADLRRLVIKR